MPKEAAAQRLVPSQKPLRQIRYLLCRSGRARACREWRPRDVVHLPADNGAACKGTVRESRGDGTSNRTVSVGDRTPDQLGNAGKRHHPRPAAVGLRIAASASARGRQCHPARWRGQRAIAGSRAARWSSRAGSITRATPGSRQHKVARSGSPRSISTDRIHSCRLRCRIPDEMPVQPLPRSISNSCRVSSIRSRSAPTTTLLSSGPAGRLLAHSAATPGSAPTSRSFLRWRPRSGRTPNP